MHRSQYYHLGRKDHFRFLLLIPHQYQRRSAISSQPSMMIWRSISPLIEDHEAWSERRDHQAMIYTVYTSLNVSYRSCRAVGSLRSLIISVWRSPCQIHDRLDYHTDNLEFTQMRSSNLTVDDIEAWMPMYGGQLMMPELKKNHLFCTSSLSSLELVENLMPSLWFFTSAEHKDKAFLETFLRWSMDVKGTSKKLPWLIKIQRAFADK